MLAQIQQSERALRMAALDELSYASGNAPRSLKLQKERLKSFSHSVLLAKRKLSAAASSRNQFLVYHEHELRTPLNAVLGFSDLLADERYGPLNGSPATLRHPHTYRREAPSQTNQRYLLTFLKLEAGRMELTREHVTVEVGLCRSDQRPSYPLAEKKSQPWLQQVGPRLHVHATRAI